VQRSPEIENLLRDMIGALERGDVAAIERMTSRQAGVVAIGSDPGEYSREFDDVMRLMGESTPDASTHIRARLDDVRAYEQGDIGWADGTGGFQREGETVEVRMTAVLRREDGEWRAVQSHASIGVPNEHMFDPLFQRRTASA
jgi:ketosteroid isomerase-like protein